MEPSIVYHPHRRAGLVDLLFGNAFFVFPNKSATLGWEIPAVGGAIPIEEFVFYLAGFMLVLLSYIWCDEYLMGSYNVRDYAATLNDPNAMGLTQKGMIEDGMAAMSQKFRDMGEQVYVDADKVKESNRVL